MEGKARLYGRAAKMSVMCLFFSPNKLIDYFPALWPARVNVHVSTRCLRTSVKQTVTFAPLPYPSLKISLLDYQLETGGWAQRRTKREDCLYLALQTYCRFTGRTRLISLSLRLERYLQNMPLLPSSFPRLSVSRYDVSTNTGTTTCLHCSCLSCFDVQSCGSEYEHSRSSVQCQSSRIQYNAIMMGNGSRFRRMNFFQEILHH